MVLGLPALQPRRPDGAIRESSRTARELRSTPIKPAAETCPTTSSPVRTGTSATTCRPPYWYGSPVAGRVLLPTAPPRRRDSERRSAVEAAFPRNDVRDCARHRSEPPPAPVGDTFLSAATDKAAPRTDTPMRQQGKQKQPCGFHSTLLCGRLTEVDRALRKFVTSLDPSPPTFPLACYALSPRGRGEQ